ncbi:uncharacterized protein BDFB_009942 [Asbolus verrucosus]|uniref:Uncharacterized protein n=1 Tax=Asbolus verrucosus TaxID=1661398 RepID=A0A482VCI3_ASBVE|nr:uncharacterized protein BDFB_009942 [Asbolus verrucosus]
MLVSLSEALIASVVVVTGKLLITDSSEQQQHRTKAATEKQHDLWCYRCDTMVDGERCLDLVGNYSYMHTKCHKEQKKCQVRRISMSTSTDEITGKPKMWLLQRNCSETCEPGCIVIGERTKLHSCITCCDEKNFCNAGSGCVAFELGFWNLYLPLVVILQYGGIGVL